jgi:CRP-like cAMP-binding protein
MDTSLQLRDQLATVPLFAQAQVSDLHVIASRTEVATVPPGTTLIREGEDGDAFYIVLDGKVDVRRKGVSVAQLGPGEYFGELALLDPAPRDADVVAATDVTFGRLSRGRLRLAIEAVPGVAEAMLGFLASRLRAVEAGEGHGVI